MHLWVTSVFVHPPEDGTLCVKSLNTRVISHPIINDRRSHLTVSRHRLGHVHILCKYKGESTIIHNFEIILFALVILTFIIVNFILMLVVQAVGNPRSLTEIIPNIVTIKRADTLTLFCSSYVWYQLNNNYIGHLMSYFKIKRNLNKILNLQKH